MPDSVTNAQCYTRVFLEPQQWKSLGSAVGGSSQAQDTVQGTAQLTVRGIVRSI